MQEANGNRLYCHWRPLASVIFSKAMVMIGKLSRAAPGLLRAAQIPKGLHGLSSPCWIDEQFYRQTERIGKQNPEARSRKSEEKKICSCGLRRLFWIQDSDS